MTPATKTEAYESIYQSLTQLQQSYWQMIMQCSRDLWEELPDDEDEQLESIQIKASLKRNISVAEDSIERLERIKYFTGLAVLTDGISITETNLANLIEEIDALILVANQEARSKDSSVQKWANDKTERLENTRGVLLQILNDKIDIQIQRGKIVYN